MHHHIKQNRRSGFVGSQIGFKFERFIRFTAYGKWCDIIDACAEIVSLVNAWRYAFWLFTAIPHMMIESDKALARYTNIQTPRWPETTIPSVRLSTMVSIPVCKPWKQNHDSMKKVIAKHFHFFDIWNFYFKSKTAHFLVSEPDYFIDYIQNDNNPHQINPCVEKAQKETECRTAIESHPHSSWANIGGF